MVLALFRKELDCPAVVLARLQRSPDRKVIQVRCEHARFAADLGRRVCVGIGDQRKAVQLRQPPVHRRIGRQAGFQRKDLGGQVAVTLSDRIETGLRAQDGKPRRPNVRRDQETTVAAVQRELQQVPRIQAQNGPAVGCQVADFGQLLNQPFRLFPARNVDQVMHLASPRAAFVDRRDFDLQHEAHGRRAGGGQFFIHAALQVVDQAKQARFRRDQIPLQFGEPLGVRKVACAQQAYALAARPPGQVRQIGLPAGGARVLGVDMQISVEHP